MTTKRTADQGPQRAALDRLMRGEDANRAAYAWRGLLAAGVIYYGQGNGCGPRGFLQLGRAVTPATGWHNGPAADGCAGFREGRCALVERALRGASWEAGLRTLDAAIRSEPRASEWRVLRGILRLVKRNGAAFELDPAAVRDLEKGVALDPESPWARLALGLALYLERRFDAARRSFERAAELRPPWLWPRLLAADSAYFATRFRESEDLFRAALKASPDSAWGHALLGRARYLRGRPSMLKALDRAAALEPAAGWILAWRGAAHALAKDRGAARRDYEAAARLSPGYERAHSWFGAFLIGEGRFPEAIGELKRARRLMPYSEVTQYALARAYRAAGDNARAKASFSKAIRINRAAAWERGWSDVQHADRACEATLSETEALLAVFPSWAEGWAWKGQTLLRLKRYGEAQESLAKAVAAAPRAVWPRVWLGECRRRLGGWRAAEEEFSRALSLDASCAWAWAGRGASRLALGSYSAARADLDRALRLEPRCGKGLALVWRGEARLRAGDAGGAGDVRAALDLHPNWHWARRWIEGTSSPEMKSLPQGQGAGARLRSDARGWALAAQRRLRAGDASGALADASLAVEEGMDPTFLPAYEIRAAAREVLGDARGAFDEWRRVLAMRPDHAAAASRARRLALDSLFAGAGLFSRLWRGLLVYGVMQNRQGVTETLDQVAAAGAEFSRKFGWSDKTAALGPAPLEALAELGPGWRQAVLAARARSCAQARRELDRAIVLAPEDPALRVLRAFLGFQVNNPFVQLSADARADLGAALARDPDCAWTHAAAGLGFFFEQSLARAIEEFKRVTELKPDWAWGHLLHGVPQWYHSQTEGSLKAFETAAALDPGLAWAHLLLGRSKADHRASSRLECDSGMEDIDRAARVERSGVVFGWRGCAHMGEGDHRKALADFNRAIAAWPFYDRAYAWRGMLRLEMDQPRRALADLRAAVKLNPHYPTAQYTLCRAYLRLGRFKDALRAQRAGAEKDRRYLWEWCWFDASHPNPAARKSVEDLDILLEKFPDSSWGYSWRGQSKMLLRDYAGAAADLERALGSDPADKWACLWLGETRRRTGKWRQAAALQTRALRLDPGLHWALAGRGGCRLQLGLYGLAVKDLDRALALNPRSGRGLAHVWRGEALWRLDRREEAARDFKTALAFYPNWWWLDLWLERVGAAGTSPYSLTRTPAKPGPARKDLDGWLRTHPFDVGGWMARAERSYGQGDFAGAVADASRVLEMNMDPTHPGALCLRALARCDLGDVRGARDEMARLEALRPSRRAAAARN